MTESSAKPETAKSVSEPKRKYRVAEAIIGDMEKRLVNEALDTGWVSSAGPFIEKFEQAFASYCGTQHGVAASNGTTALHLALAAMNIGSGDEVIIPAITFVATAEAVVYCGAIPVIADVDPHHWCLTPASIDAVRTARTRAIMPVHLFGQ